MTPQDFSAHLAKLIPLSRFHRRGKFIRYVWRFEETHIAVLVNAYDEDGASIRITVRSADIVIRSYTHHDKSEHTGRWIVEPTDEQLVELLLRLP